jgi:hypothetical protein
MNDRPLTPSSTSIQLSQSELEKRAFPGGRLPVKGATNNAYGDAKYTPIGDASPAAVAAAQERHEARAKPALVAKRERAGK